MSLLKDEILRRGKLSWAKDRISTALTMLEEGGEKINDAKLLLKRMLEVWEGI